MLRILVLLMFLSAGCLTNGFFGVPTEEEIVLRNCDEVEGIYQLVGGQFPVPPAVEAPAEWLYDFAIQCYYGHERIALHFQVVSAGRDDDVRNIQMLQTDHEGLQKKLQSWGFDVTMGFTIITDQFVQGFGQTDWQAQSQTQLFWRGNESFAGGQKIYDQGAQLFIAWSAGTGSTDGVALRTDGASGEGGRYWGIDYTLRPVPVDGRLH